MVWLAGHERGYPRWYLAADLVRQAHWIACSEVTLGPVAPSSTQPRRARRMGGVLGRTE